MDVVWLTHGENPKKVSKMVILAEYQFSLPFYIRYVEGAMDEPIQYDFGDAQVVIHEPTFAEGPAIYESGFGPGLPDPPKLEALGGGMGDKKKWISGGTGGKIIYNVNLVPIDITKEVEQLEDVSTVPSICDPIAERVIRKFIELCRFRTGDVRIDCRSIIRYSSSYYIDDTPVKGRLLLYVSRPLPPVAEEIADLISNDLKTHYSIPLSQSLLLDALSLIETRNLRSAIIEAVTALEVAVSDFLRDYLRSRNMDNNEFIESVCKFWNRWESLMNRLELAVKLLPLGIQNEIKDKGLYEQCKRANKKRNKVVHDGIHIPAKDKNQIKEMINGIEEMITYLNKQP